MFGRIAGILILIATFMVGNVLAQVPQAFFAVDIQPAWTKYRIDFHDGQYSSVLRAQRMEISLVGVFPRFAVMRYSFLSGIDNRETFTPAGMFAVGGEEWKTEQEAKPLSILVNLDTSHRLDLEFLPHLAVRPLVVLDRLKFSLIAEGENSGKMVRATEEFDRSLWGVGASCSVDLVSVRVAAGSGYRFVDTSIIQPVSSWAGVGVAYQHRSVSLEGISIRSDGFFIRMGIRF